RRVILATAPGATSGGAEVRSSKLRLTLQANCSRIKEDGECLSDGTSLRTLTCSRGLMELFTCREPISAWTHGAWMLLCVPAGVLLQMRARGSLLKRLGFAIFT